MPTRDLSQSLDADATVYPGDPPVESTPAATHEEDGYRVTEWRLGTHSGTHVDAPSHTEPDGKNLDAFGVEEFAFEARLVDCSGVGAREPIGSEMVPERESERGRTETNGMETNGTAKSGTARAEMVVFRTGWADHWGTDRYFDHPYLTREAAATCADRGFHVGMDALSPDPSPSERETAEETEPEGVPAHRELLGSDRLVVENLTGLAGLPERFELRAYPLALAAADGSPVRAVATW
ncbi:cyclase family protein [Halorussus salinus]|uniref:cyclase family protein n=1 Tax=Halorussus salinus TaxID=1364935 RepID=UPI001092F661|nr:cyclase family protein [Halorussus salinus]